jgi:hypothetical protein
MVHCLDTLTPGTFRVIEIVDQFPVARYYCVVPLHSLRSRPCFDFVVSFVSSRICTVTEHPSRLILDFFILLDCPGHSLIDISPLILEFAITTRTVSQDQTNV